MSSQSPAGVVGREPIPLICGQKQGELVKKLLEESVAGMGGWRWGVDQVQGLPQRSPSGVSDGSAWGLEKVRSGGQWEGWSCPYRVCLCQHRV